MGEGAMHSGSSVVDTRMGGGVLGVSVPHVRVRLRVYVWNTSGYATLGKKHTNAAAGISPVEREKEAVFLASRSGAAAVGLKPGCRRAPASTPAPASSPRLGSEEGKRRGPWHPAEPDRARGGGGRRRPSHPLPRGNGRPHIGGTAEIKRGPSHLCAVPERGPALMRRPCRDVAMATGVCEAPLSGAWLRVGVVWGGVGGWGLRRQGYCRTGLGRGTPWGCCSLSPPVGGSFYCT